jgi:hypothetical protein
MNILSKRAKRKMYGVLSFVGAVILGCLFWFIIWLTLWIGYDLGLQM